MKYITSTNLATWAPERDCQENFPLLVRRLIRASPVEVHKMLFPVGDNVILPGYDGTLEMKGTYQHIPDGNSIWEIGTGKDYEVKANKDFAKRATALTDAEKSGLTFVFVTPLVWKDKDVWIDKKKLNSTWKDIRVIDGLQLEEWIETLPAIGSWLSKFLNLPQGNTLPLDEYWQEWSENEKYKIPASLIMYGRDNEVGKTVDFLLGDPGQFSLKANTSAEALAFIAASIEKMDPEKSETTFARAIIIDNEHTFRDVSALSSPMIIVAKFDPAGLITTAIKNGHHIIIPLGNDLTISGSASIELPRIPRRGFEKGLEEMGLSRTEAERRIKDSGLSLTVLRRLLDFDQYKQPAWAQHGSFADIIPALLVGMWDEQSEGDKQIISAVAGESYESYIKKLARWKLDPDAPVFQIRSIWRITSPLDAWSILAPYVTTADIENFRSSFLLVLGELNPALELKVEKRYMASFFGKIPKFSHALKEGLIESLILIAVFGESFRLTLTYSGQAFADRIVRDLLEEADGAKWCSLSDVLPILSEASPEAFLRAVEKSLNTNKPTILEMFGQKGDPLFSSSSYYTGLLWALENLAYSQEYLWRVTLLLGTLARLDPGGQLSNRPINSLVEIHVAWYRQVNADLDTRKGVLEKLMQKEPGIAWKLFLQLLPDPHGGIAHPIHFCRWRFNTQIERTVLREEVWDIYSFVFDKLLILAKGNRKRMSEMVSLYPEISKNDRAKLLTFLAENNDSIEDAENLVWDKLRSLLSRHREHAAQSWAIPETECKKIEEVFVLYTPKESLRGFLYLFKENWPEFPSGKRKWKMDGEAFIKEQRINALKNIYAKGGLQEILKMTEALENLSILGNSLTEINLTPEEELLILKGIIADPTDKLHLLCRQYIFAKSIKDEQLFVDHAWQQLFSLQPTEKVQATFFLSLVPRRYNWIVLESLPSSVVNEYWANVNVWLNHFAGDDRLYAISKLQQANRHILLINQLSYFAGELPSDLLVLILNNAASIQSVGQDRFEEYNVAKLFEEIQKRTDIDTDKLANLEWQYIYILTNYSSEGKAVTLLSKLSTDVSFFIDLVSLVYLPDEGTDDGVDREQQVDRYKKAEPARRLLESWRVIPGTQEDGSINKLVLDDWIKNVRSKATSVNRQHGVDSEIGKLMACYPRNTDRWPSEEIADVIDTLDSETVVLSFETEIFNSRGTTVRGAYDGGGQERSLAAYFEKMSNSLMPKYPVTATALLRLAKGYKQDAVQEDERAHLDELR